MLCRITTLEKSERLDSLPYDFINGTPPLTYSGYSDFFGANYFTKQLQTTDCKGFFICLECHDYYFRRAAQRQLSQCNSRNTATVLRAVVKSHNGLKGTKVFACGCSGRNLKNLSKFAGKSPCWDPFIVKLQPVIAYKRFLGQLYQKRNAYTETLSQALPVNLEKL